MTTKLAVNVQTSEEWDKVMQIIEKLEPEKRWASRNKPTENNYFHEYKEESCIDLSDDYLGYSNKEYYQSEGFKILTYQEFLEHSLGLTQTKTCPTCGGKGVI